MVVETRKNPEN